MIYYNEFDSNAAAWLRELKLQAEFFGGVMHTIKQSVTRRAEHPDLVWPNAVFRVAPLTISFMSRFVSDIKNAMLAARFAASWGIRIGASESDKVVIGQLLGFCSLAIDGFSIRFSRVPFASCFSNACPTALVGTQPLIVLAFCDWKGFIANAAGVIVWVGWRIFTLPSSFASP